MKKKLLAVLLVVSMVAALAGCASGNTQTGGSAPATTEGSKDSPDASGAVDYPVETLMIGVELYDPTDSETIALQEYLSYLEKNMNVKFKYSEAVTTADEEIQFIEDCAISGCKGFIAYYNVTGAEQINKTSEYEMYYWGMANETEIYEANKENPYYLGSIHTGNSDYEGGHALAEWVLAQGFDKIIYASGGADIGVSMFIDRQKGFTDGLEGSNVDVITVSGFPGDQFFADQSAALSQEGVQAVVASFNGVNFWAQPIESAGLSGKVKLATIGSVNQSCVDAFKSGALDFLYSGNIQRFGLAVGMIANAVDGNADALKSDGFATNIPAHAWAVNNAEECQKLLDIQNGERVYTVADIISICVSQNPEADSQTLMDLVDASSTERLLGNN